MRRNYTEIEVFDYVRSKGFKLLCDPAMICEYLLMCPEDYTLEQWFKDTLENYADEYLQEI